LLQLKAGTPPSRSGPATLPSWVLDVGSVITDGLALAMAIVLKLNSLGGEGSLLIRSKLKRCLWINCEVCQL